MINFDLNELGQLGSMLSGIATCFAVFVAWKAKNEWFSENHFQLKNQLVSNMLDVYMKGVKYCEFQHAISGLTIQAIQTCYKNGGEFKIPEEWEKQAVKNLQDFDNELQRLIKQSLIVESLNNKHKDLTNRIVTCSNRAFHLLQYTNLTNSEFNIDAVEEWENRYSICLDGKMDFEEAMRLEIKSISNDLLGMSLNFEWLNLDTNFISIEQFLDIDIKLVN